MTKNEMLSYIKQKIAICENMAEYAKQNKVDKVVLHANEELMDVYKSLLPIVGTA